MGNGASATMALANAQKSVTKQFDSVTEQLTATNQEYKPPRTEKEKKERQDLRDKEFEKRKMERAERKDKLMQKWSSGKYSKPVGDRVQESWYKAKTLANETVEKLKDDDDEKEADTSWSQEPEEPSSTTSPPKNSAAGRLAALNASKAKPDKKSAKKERKTKAKAEKKQAKPQKAWHGGQVETKAPPPAPKKDEWWNE